MSKSTRMAAREKREAKPEGAHPFDVSCMSKGWTWIDQPSAETRAAVRQACAETLGVS